MKPDLSLLRAEIAEIEARKPLTRAQVIEVLCRQAGGIACGCGCGEPLAPLTEGCIDEHMIAREFRYGDPDDLSNRAFLRKPCATRKTKADLRALAKCKRLTGETGTRARKPIPRHVNPWPPAGSQKLGSRPFPKDQRKKRTRT